MIPCSASHPNTGDWRRQLVEGFRTPAELLAHLELPPPDRGTEAAAAAFPLRVPRYYAGLMRRGDAEDPLLRQVLPRAEELRSAPGFGPDPTGDHAAVAGPGVLRKYAGRALLLVTGACAVHCRYCFRRHFPYADHRTEGAHWEAVIQTLRSTPEVREVILSGGDPLLPGNGRLARLVRRLSALPGLRRLRIHTRLPVVLPARVDSGLVALLADSGLATSVVLHANHPAEITPALGRALAPLRRRGVTLLNQAVLLRGVNDDPEIQVELAEKLFDIGILPYYLHQLDKVAGAAHFEVEEERARALHRIMRERLPGYLLPALVREHPGAAAKMPL